MGMLVLDIIATVLHKDTHAHAKLITIGISQDSLETCVMIIMVLIAMVIISMEIATGAKISLLYITI